MLLLFGLDIYTKNATQTWLLMTRHKDKEERKMAHVFLVTENIQQQTTGVLESA